MREDEYIPEKYWDEVAKKISNRDDLKLIAGDDEPYYRYKRKKFLKLFNTLDFENKVILEVGSGPGGNLEYLTRKKCKEIVGADVSGKMINLSIRILKDKPVKIIKVDGLSLPFPDGYFDIVFTSTVLQHNTNETNLRRLISEICRVSRSDVVLFERVENKIMGHESNVGRPISFYAMMAKDNNFSLVEAKCIQIQASYLVSGTIRKLFNKRSKKEGEPISGIARFLQNITLPVTSLIDKIMPSHRDLTMMYFRKNIS